VILAARAPPRSSRRPSPFHRVSLSNSFSLPRHSNSAYWHRSFGEDLRQRDRTGFRVFNSSNSLMVAEQSVALSLDTEFMEIKGFPAVTMRGFPDAPRPRPLATRMSLTEEIIFAPNSLGRVHVFSGASSVCVEDTRPLFWDCNTFLPNARKRVPLLRLFWRWRWTSPTRPEAWSPLSVGLISPDWCRPKARGDGCRSCSRIVSI